MNALLGFVSDAILTTIFGLNLTCEAKTAAARAFTKLLWVQNDLINRHYAAPCAKDCGATGEGRVEPS
jgi:hypothetical protein